MPDWRNIKLFGGLLDGSLNHAETFGAMPEDIDMSPANLRVVGLHSTTSSAKQIGVLWNPMRRVH